MADDKIKAGQMVWVDLTVPDADLIRDFYAAVAGWTYEPVKMGDYSDYNMISKTGDPAAGICFQRGANANLPSQWLIYIAVDDLAVAMRRCIERGGKIVDGPRGVGDQRFCVIQDPAGAYMGLIGT